MNIFMRLDRDTILSLFKLTAYCMLSYRDIPIWTIFSRISQLRRFEQQFDIYLSNNEQTCKDKQQSTAVSRARQKLNENAHRILQILKAAEIDPIIYHGREVNLILELFHLDRIPVPSQAVFDLLHRSIGVYKHELGLAFFRTINPFYYVWRLLDILGAFFFGAPKQADRKQAGLIHLIQGILAFLITIITVCSASLSIADHFGYQPDVDGFLKAKGGHFFNHTQLPDWLQY